MVKRRSTDGYEEIWVQCGVGPRRAAAAARWLLAQQVDSLAVFGVSGGLDPALAAGDLVLASAVVDCCSEEKADHLNLDAEDGQQLLLSGGIRVHFGPVVTVNKPVFQLLQKKALFTEHNALAVDMESAAVARVAAEKAISCTVLRAICDSAHQAIPSDALAIIDQTGRLRWVGLLLVLARRPGLLFDLLRMRGDFCRALQPLKQAAPVVIRQMISGGKNSGRFETYKLNGP
jgi:adenosylhomocysteine nucleosidase